VTKVTRYVYDGADVCAEYEDSNTDGAVDRTRVYWLLPGMDRRIGFAENVGGTNTFYYYLTDQVGTVLRIVKEDGTVVNQYDYDAFGRVRQASPNTFATVENRYLFQGREWDKNGGFYYFRNRIYLPERGEFATPDMNLGRGILGELDGMATLTFCGGDPVNCIDPTGLANEIVATIDGVNVGRVLNANDYAVINASANGLVRFGKESFEIYEANAGSVVTSTKVMLDTAGKSSYVVGETAAGIFIPGVGEAMDASVLADPASGKWEQRIAGASLSLGLMTGGAMPNIGRPASRGIRFVKGLFTKGGKVVSGVDNQMSSVVRLQPSTAGAGDVAAKGGTYGEVRVANAGGEVHHLPMKSALKAAGHPMGAGSKAPNGPAIYMETPNHRALLSSRGQGEALSSAQAASIKPGPGGLDDAFLMGVDEVQAIYGSMYDEIILKAMDKLP